MNQRIPWPLVIGSLLPAMGWGCSRDPTSSEIDPFCSSQPASAIVMFEDANLEAEIRDALGLGSKGELICGLLETVTTLTAAHAGIASLAGIENLTRLTVLQIRGNSITDISALSGLRSLTFLAINENGNITDISALSELTNLTGLNAWNNSITDLSVLRGLTNLAVLTPHTNPDLSDIQPLLDNPRLGAGDDVLLRSTNVSCTDVDALRAKGVGVVSECP